MTVHTIRLLPDPVLRQKAKRFPQYFPVGDAGIELHAWLDLVVAGEQPHAVSGRPEAGERVADAAIPVDQRAIAVEGGTAVGNQGATR